MLQSEIVLKKLGLSEHETRVYLTGLKSGPSLASSIARQSGLGRTLVYHLIDQLKNKGLLSEQGTGNGKRFAMEPPERLLDIVERKQKELEGVAISISQIAKELKSLPAAFAGVPQIRVYEGAEGLKNFAKETVSQKNTLIKSITPVDFILKMVDRFFLRYWSLERHKNNISAKTVFTGTPQKSFSTDQVKKLLEVPHTSTTLHQWRKAPNDLVFSSLIIIFGTKVAVVSHPEKPSVFFIDSASFAQAMETLFDDIWKRSTVLKER